MTQLPARADATIPTDTLVACSHCAALLPFKRSEFPHIDACGFESYAFDCVECGASLAGVIDPADEKLLLCEVAI